ncbi:MAG: signal peptidase I [Candidatus Sumerlaeia bacterium]|nr:signal peptidase I [Candidatus Sumerlaeia bacterium]
MTKGRFLKRAGVMRLTISAVILLIVGTIWLQLYTGRLQAIQVTSISMLPTIEEGDRMFTVSLRDNEKLERGELVVMNPPYQIGLDLIKRVVGMPGDTISLRNGFLWINGEMAMMNAETASMHPGAQNQELVLEEGWYFLLGDNRPHSHDSTEFGPVPRSAIKSRVLFRYRPMSKFGKLPPIELTATP